VKLPELVEVWICEGPAPRGKTCGTVLLTKSGKDFTWICPIHKKNTDFMCLGEMPMPKQIVDALREELTG
jgi:hypothetical protein